MFMEISQGKPWFVKIWTERWDLAVFNKRANWNNERINWNNEVGLHIVIRKWLDYLRTTGWLK